MLINRNSVNYQVLPEDIQEYEKMNENFIINFRVLTFVNERQKMGEYNLLWDGKNESGRKLAAGQYYFVLKAGKFISTRRSISLQ
jgi:hypothetical protein